MRFEELQKQNKVGFDSRSVAASLVLIYLNDFHVIGIHQCREQNPKSSRDKREKGESHHAPAVSPPGPAPGAPGGAGTGPRCHSGLSGGPRATVRRSALQSAHKPSSAQAGLWPSHTDCGLWTWPRLMAQSTRARTPHSHDKTLHFELRTVQPPD